MQKPGKDSCTACLLPHCGVKAVLSVKWELHLLHEVSVRTKFTNVWKAHSTVTISSKYFVNGNSKGSSNFKPLIMNITDGSSVITAGHYGEDFLLFKSNVCSFRK